VNAASSAMHDRNEVVERRSGERAWLIAALVCLICATIFLWRRNIDAVFVTATLGVVMWFISLRNRLKATLSTAESSNDENTESGDKDEA
jgi:hypothetical protein